jgi:hypothetical protein
MDSSKMTLISILRDRVGELCEEGNYSEALHAANAAVAKAEQELTPAQPALRAVAQEAASFSLLTLSCTPLAQLS